MALYDPFSEVSRLRQRIERLFEEGVPARADAPSRVWRPLVDLFEDDDQLVLKLDLPGIDPQTLDVQLTGEELVIRGERPWKAPESGGVVYAERPHGQFHRGFKLGIPLKHEAVEAAYRDGVLTVTLPKADTMKPKKIAISAESTSA